MGYYVDSIDYTSFKIDRDKFMAAVLKWEEEHPGEHISWCDRVSDIAITAEEVLTRFGFDITFDAPASPDYQWITIEFWGGDKMGSTWEDMWEDMLAPAAAPDTNTVWIMRGEDGETWCEEIIGNEHRQWPVEVIYDIKRIVS